MSPSTQKIVPHLWFDATAEPAAASYSTLLPNSGVSHVGRYSEAGAELHGQKPGSVMSIELQIDGYTVGLINGGPRFRPSPALSLFVMFENETDLDRGWHTLVDGGAELMPLDAYDWSPKYGWLTDRHGVSWQLALGKRSDVGGMPVVPSFLFTQAVAGRAEEAINRYTSIFPDAQIEGILRHDGRGPDPEGTIMHAQFKLAGQTFMAMDSAHGHDFSFTEGVSLMVICENQDEVDHYWSALSAVPEAEACGWLKDAFGVTWQVVPRTLLEGMRDPDPAVVKRVTEAFMAMKKLNVAELERARRG